MKQISGQHYDIWRNLQHVIDRAPESLSHVGFTLIDAVLGQTVVLAKTEVQIGEMGELHWSRGLTQ
jgi:hypothetical protein